MTDLPDGLREALESQPGPVCLAVEVNNQAAILIKAPREDLASFRGRHVIQWQPQLARYPHGAVLRFYLEIHDRPGAPYQGEAFLNIADEHDAKLAGKFAQQRQLEIHFYTLDLEYDFSKRIRVKLDTRRDLMNMIEMAREHNALGVDEHDFAKAKAQFMSEYPL